ncbi:phenylalanyl-tRNA synthetase subunit beta, partial [mine drainage metagenome]
GKYLALLDKNGEIISIPPVLISKKTMIDESTQNFLVDITASELTQGKKLMFLSIYYFYSLGYEIFTDPNLHKWKEFEDGFKEIKISGKEEISKLIGLKLEDDEISKNLRKMGYNINNLSIRVPYYR